MGNLHEKKIDSIRSYIDPLDPTPLPQLDYDLIYPITVYSAVHRDMTDGSTTLEQDLESLRSIINGKQDPISGGTPGALMTWTHIPGEIGETILVDEINSEPDQRSNKKVVSERGLGRLFDLKSDKVDLNKHINDLNIHLTEDEKNVIANAITSDEFNDHINNEDIHVTAEEKTSWSNKADGTTFNSHVSNNDNPHHVTAHQIGTYSRAEIDQIIDTLHETFFVYVNIKYNPNAPEGKQAELVEYDEDNWNPNYVLSHGDDLPTVIEDSLTYFALKPATDFSTNESNECLIYIKEPNRLWKQVGISTLERGYMVIRYPDATMCVWLQGRFKMLFEGSGGGSSDMMWRPLVSADGVLGWTRSAEVNPPDPVIIKGEPGYTPQKGVDYFDGAPGLGLPAGGSREDIMVKTTNADYDTEWISFADFLQRYLDEGGTIPGWTADWNTLQNKPEIYNELGNSEKDLVSQKLVTDNVNSISDQIVGILNVLNGSGGTGGIIEELSNHLSNTNNPHNVTPNQIGAASSADLSNHINNNTNPHRVTAAQLGLGNVNNTADLDKPISTAQRIKFDQIDNAITQINDIINAGELIETVNWDPVTLTLTFTFRDSSDLEIVLPILSIFESITWNSEAKAFELTLPDGSIHQIPIQGFITEYTGSIGQYIKISIDTDGVIHGDIIDSSIDGSKLVNNIQLPGNPTVATANVSDKSNKIANTEYVKNLIIDNLTSTNADRPLSASMGKYLNDNKTTREEVQDMINSSPLVTVVDNLTSTDTHSSLSANMGRALNLQKAEKVHTSSSGSENGRATDDLFGHVRAYSQEPLMDGEANDGTDNGFYAKGDHRHPTDISRASVEALNELADRVDHMTVDIDPILQTFDLSIVNNHLILSYDNGKEDD